MFKITVMSVVELTHWGVRCLRWCCAEVARRLTLLKDHKN